MRDQLVNKDDVGDVENAQLQPFSGLSTVFFFKERQREQEIEY